MIVVEPGNGEGLECEPLARIRMAYLVCLNQPAAVPARKKVRFIAVITNSAALGPGGYSVYAGVPSAGGAADLEGQFTLVSR